MTTWQVLKLMAKRLTNYILHYHHNHKTFIVVLFVKYVAEFQKGLRNNST